MRVAIIHDYLNQYGGAERVLESLLAIFPNADVYTLLFDSERTGGRFDAHVWQTSFLDRPLVKKNHRPFIPLMPLAASRLKLSPDYDLIISATAGFAKGIACPSHTFHLSYCYTPLRYAWETRDYFTSRLFTAAFAPAFAYLRAWDRRAAQRPDTMLAISRFIAEKVRSCYGRNVAVVYPPVDTDTFYPDAKVERGDYYLAVGRLLAYKRFDLAIRAFSGLSKPLKVVGVGPEEEHLVALARGSPNITFHSFVSDGELRRLYTGARALIFPQVEDFGLVAAEAQACGCPVIAFAQGGGAEIVSDGKTGVLFRRQSPDALMDAVRRFELLSLDRLAIHQSAQRFNVSAFTRGLLSQLPEQLVPSRVELTQREPSSIIALP